jgi:hypothetical protein
MDKIFTWKGKSSSECSREELLELIDQMTININQLQQVYESHEIKKLQHEIEKRDAVIEFAKSLKR